ncbi:MAG: hypothetical protein ACWGIK_12760 [Achromobacter pulmonis]|uniref:Uncharacterized protein n=1 Tax=Achromobacter pulmonis TaxID=1389932 RepID=A0A6S7CN27_9BURK|nr:hypothetical protein [Achromobacter pulmonis]MCF7766368.1 hypothetical protein [Achromobacter pulmonis]CAB3856316.1 hypothetical protein LMG26788_02024 [Achromobacter pulmonis]
MPHYPSDAGIPTLTQRAEPTLAPYQPPPSAGSTPASPARDVGRPDAGDTWPVLTDVADDDVPLLTDVASDEEPAHPAGSAAPLPREPLTETPPSPILAARLQAEIEQAMRLALADAISQVQARLDAELPAIVARVMREVRPG